MIVDEFDFDNGIFGQIRYKKDTKIFFNKIFLKDDFGCYLVNSNSGTEIYLTSTRTQSDARAYLFQLHNSRHK